MKTIEKLDKPLSLESLHDPDEAVTPIDESDEPEIQGEDVVDEIGKAAGVTYQEGESLRIGQKEEERDAHRWELDPASAEDYVQRSHEPELEAVEIRRMQHPHREKRG
jgi:Family of unknown function (DUF6335)